MPRIAIRRENALIEVSQMLVDFSAGLPYINFEKEEYPRLPVVSFEQSSLVFLTEPIIALVDIGDGRVLRQIVWLVREGEMYVLECTAPPTPSGQTEANASRQNCLWGAFN